MSILQNAQNVSIYGGNFISAQALHQHISYVKTASDILKENAVLGALHDSSERFDPPRCHPATRTAVLNRIDLWARNAEGASPVLWLHGAAGAGKSAIAQTLCEKWKEQDTLIASFFFSRAGIKRNENTFLIPTIAYQLASYVPSTREIIEEAILNDPGVFEKNLRTQTDTFLIRPLTTVPELDKPLVIVIDGLDECSAGISRHDYAYQQKEVLEAITFACQHIPSLRVFVASRPEQQIRDCFAKKPLTDLVTQVILNDTLNPTADIRLFLRCRFEEIKQSNPLIDPSWPSDASIHQIVLRSSGQFIYPSVVMRYISNPRENPVTSLNKILQLETGRDFRSGEKPFADIDAVYTLILASVSPKSQSIVMDVLGVLTSIPRMGTMSVTSVSHRTSTRIFEDTENPSPLFFERLLFLPPGEIYMHLIDLHSILEIPPPQDHQRDRPIRFLHATLPEFLTDHSRAREFVIGKTSYAIHRQKLLCQHFKSDNSKVPYDHENLTQVLREGLMDCPPMRDVRDITWDILSDELGTYPPPLNILKSRKSLLAGEGGSSRLDSYDRLRMIPYLQRCNIVEIEPSTMVRLRVSRCLKEAENRHRRSKR